MPLLGGGKPLFRGVATPGGRLLVPKPGAESTSVKNQTRLCLARRRLWTENLGRGDRQMPGAAGAEALPDLALTSQYWPEAQGRLG